MGASQIRDFFLRTLILLGPLALLACHSAPVKSQALVAAQGASLTQANAITTAPPPEVQMYAPSATNGPTKPDAHDGEKTSPIEAPEKALFARQITTVGDNFGASFSPDGTRILYQSRGRITNKQAQLFELRLSTMNERRVTFQDGEVGGAGYYPDGDHVIYSSSTDEIKEEDVYLESILKTYLPGKTGKTKKTESVPPSGYASLGNSDIYRESLDGRDIERLTASRGFDGEPSVDAKGSRVVFTSDRSGLAHLFLFSAHGLNQYTDVEFPDRYARFSPDGQSILWSRFSKDYKTSRLTLAEGPSKNALAISAPGFMDIHPSWHPGGADIVFSSNRGGQGFDLYVIDRGGKCLRRLTNAKGDEIYPAFNADGTKIVFTGNQSGTNQIYLMDYRPGTSCL